MRLLTLGAAVAGAALVVAGAPVALVAATGGLSGDSGSSASAAPGEGHGHAYGHQKHNGHHDDKTASDEKGDHGPGRAHAQAMQRWAHCVADAAAKKPADKSVRPKDACGDKPLPPGLAHGHGHGHPQDGGPHGHRGGHPKK